MAVSKTASTFLESREANVQHRYSKFDTVVVAALRAPAPTENEEDYQKPLHYCEYLLLVCNLRLFHN